MNRITTVVSLLLAWLCSPAFAAAGDPLPAATGAAIVTILDGPANLIRDTRKFALLPGVRLADGDIVSTGAAARLLRIELANGGFINLGPATRMLLAPRLSGERGRRGAAFYLLEGWVKTSANFATPAVDLSAGAGTAVLYLAPGLARCFSESGTVSLVSSQAGTATSHLKAGEFLELRQHARALLQPRPSAAFLQEMPKPFADTLPALAGQFEHRTPEPRLLGTPDYAELQPWLDGEAALRLNYLARWSPLARRPEFKDALIVHLPAHPEWRTVLFPETRSAASAERMGSTP